MDIGLFSPGEMGAAVGAQLVAAGHRVAWASAGRGEATAARAAAAGLLDLRRAGEVAARSDLVLSVVPPQFALETATLVAATGFGGRYVDANAIAPETARRVAAAVARGGASFVDGGIVGSPPAGGTRTRLYLSGEEAAAVAELFSSTAVQAVVLPGGPGAASALKLAYAAWTKGSAALLLGAHELAERSGVAEALEAEWKDSQAGLPDRLQRALASRAAKGWRWTPEMREIAAAMR
ncbi:MAG: DUF1932 domain-containing protein, partial [Candidatus Dormibacteraceae bacterium]